MKSAALIFVAICASVAAGQTVSDNAKLTQLFNEDQGARRVKSIIWSDVSAADAARREAVHKMLEAGEVRTADDYYHAALIYQHGQKPDDYLLAHVLAVDAISLGDKDARWLSAATLDRYLLSISQSQIFGTQFQSTPGKNDSWVLGTMNPNLLSDSMRALLCVIPASEQQKVLDDVTKGKPFRSTEVEDCR